MGKEARARGTYEERRAAAIARNAEAKRLYYEKLDAEADRRDIEEANRRASMTPKERAAETAAKIRMSSYLGMAMAASSSMDDRWII